jgi:MSHA biogenesis protein MshJ
MTAGFRQSFNRVLERIDALSLRERAILFVGVLAAVYLVASNVAFQSLFAERNRLDRELASKREQTRALQAQIEKIAEERGRDPNETNRQRIVELKAKLRDREGALSTVLHGVVSPREMARMVEQVLSRNRALTVVSVENLAPVPLTDEGGATGDKPAAAGGKASAGTGGMYKHGLRIELTGQYPDIMRYLHALETLPWKVFWGEVRLETQNYPVSRVTLVIYTLSLDDAWISV